ncbi:MAG: hypothetical protein E6G44_10010 [Actinobacteria bacterium]|nr:MAG: hypothetical protein E6G44_10010 [Actinomycetota bacterium]
MKNLMDADLSESECMLVDVYRQLARTLEMYGDELPPFARRNGLKALAALWQVMNGLDMDPGQLYHVGA